MEQEQRIPERRHDCGYQHTSSPKDSGGPFSLHSSHYKAINNKHRSHCKDKAIKTAYKLEESGYTGVSKPFYIFHKRNITYEHHR